jgi:hypothetical protein
VTETIAGIVARAGALQAEIDRITAPPKITKATQPTISETLWRCAVCRKWSPAKRKPRGHRRFIRDSDLDRTYEGAERIFPEQTLEGVTREGGWMVRCGPFEKWEAWKVESP